MNSTVLLNLGGSVLGFASADSSSASKGESISDTIRVISCYADICAMRHPKEGAALVASQKSRIPVINAGDGGHQHPTQTLTDLMTIRSLKGRLGNITIGLCGDLKFGRTVHSLINALIRYENVKFILISPEELKIPATIVRSKDGRPLNGNLLYTICPIQAAVELFYERQFRQLEEDAARQRAAARLAESARESPQKALCAPFGEEASPCAEPGLETEFDPLSGVISGTKEKAG